MRRKKTRKEERRVGSPVHLIYSQGRNGGGGKVGATSISLLCPDGGKKSSRGRKKDTSFLFSDCFKHVPADKKEEKKERGGGKMEPVNSTGIVFLF